MTGRDAGILLKEMLESIAIIHEYLADIDQQAFLAHRITQDAVIRRLKILGEAASQLPSPVKDRFPAVDWRSITAMRNRLIHGYFTVNLTVVWNTAKSDLPLLEGQARAMLLEVEGEAKS